jgi:hypothetical protein
MGYQPRPHALLREWLLPGEGLTFSIQRGTTGRLWARFNFHRTDGIYIWLVPSGEVLLNTVPQSSRTGTASAAIERHLDTQFRQYWFSGRQQFKTRL